jgi:hypothetical protein
VAFPILVANVVDDLVDRGLPASLSSGDPMILSLAGETESVLVTLPDGNSRTLAVPATQELDQRSLTFDETGQPGTYVVQFMDRAGTATAELNVIVNAGHPQESNLAPNPLLTTALQTPTAASDAGSARLRFDLWPIVLFAVLALLLLEWLVTLLTGNRRTLLHNAGRGAG